MIIYDYKHFLCAYILLLKSITLIMKAFKAHGAYTRWVIQLDLIRNAGRVYKCI